MDISNSNYFELFSLEESFQVNPGLLNQEYKTLQAQYHPDKFINEQDSVRLQALQISSILNDAYTTLESPLKRAAYLLTMHGVDPDENVQSHLGSDFLLQQIELREELENLSKSEDMDELEHVKKDVESEIQNYFQEFEKHYTQAAYTSAKPVYSKLQFLCKLLSEIESLEETLLEY